jgi:hypothetical protein
MGDYNLGEVAAQLYVRKEEFNTERSDEKLRKIEELTEEMQLVQRFLSEMSKATKDKESDAVDWREKPENEEKRRMVDALAAKHPHLMESGVYQFEGKEIDATVQRLQNHVNHVLSQEQSMKWAQQSQIMQESTSLLEITSNIMKNCDQLRSFIQQAIARAH